MEETYYKKILVTSGEVPEEDDWYHTSEGLLSYSDGVFEAKIDNDYWETFNPTYWLKEISIPSPKQEAMRFAEMVHRFTVKYVAEDRYLIDPAIWPDDKLEYTLSELYDKFKQRGESK